MLFCDKAEKEDLMKTVLLTLAVLAALSGCGDKDDTGEDTGTPEDTGGETADWSRSENKKGALSPFFILSSIQSLSWSFHPKSWEKTC